MLLLGPKAGVQAVGSEQLVVSTALTDRAFVEDDDLIRFDDGREPGRDHHGGALTACRSEVFNDPPLGRHINGAEAVVEDQDAPGVKQRTRRSLRADVDRR